MLLRLLVILTLVWQPFMLRGAGLTAAPVCGMSCCEVVVKTNCCGDTVVARVSVTDEESCGCAVAPTDEQPRPETPRPGSDRETLVSVEASDATFAPSTLPNESIGYGFGGPLGLHGSLSHNQVQALLGIWRT